jgi:hypothetical protein
MVYHSRRMMMTIHRFRTTGPVAVAVCCAMGTISISRAQDPAPVFQEGFDSVRALALPAGWTSTRNRSPGQDDFSPGASIPHSPPNAILTSNATIAQALTSPLVHLGGKTADRLSFYIRRSPSYSARLLVEAAPDGAEKPFVQIGDTLKIPGEGSYSLVELPIIETLARLPAMAFRWRVLPDSVGVTGTLRIDDITLSARLSNDLALTRISLSTSAPQESSNVTARLTVKNLGAVGAAGFTATLFLDGDRDSLAEAGECIASAFSASAIAPGDSVTAELAFTVAHAGEWLLIATVLAGEDQDTRNNQLSVPIAVAFRRRALVVNEIMYAPAGGEPEWVELHNPSGDPVNVRNWSISDATNGSPHLLTSAATAVPGRGYFIVTRDSAALTDARGGIPCAILAVQGFPSLNNDGDAVMLRDHLGGMVDSVSYLAGWGGNSAGRSLERIDPHGESSAPSNWGTSRANAGSTPGRENSLSPKAIDLSVDTVLLDPKAPCTGDPVVLAVRVRNAGRSAIPFFDLVVQDSAGGATQILTNLHNENPLGPSAVRVQSVNVTIRQAGRHAISARALVNGDDDTTNNESAVRFSLGLHPGSTLINEVMFAPPAGVPEWVEFLNASSDSIDFQGWSIGNRQQTSRYKVTTLPARFGPGEFAVVTKDTALLRQAYGAVPGMLLQSAALPTFLWNNTGDAVVMRDDRDVVMDSLFYRGAWGGTGGTSLERVDPLVPSGDSTNWSSSADSLKATPGKANSVVVVDQDLRVLPVPSTAVPPGVPASIEVKLKNTGRRTAGPAEVLLFHDADGDSLAEAGELVARSVMTPPLPSRDSVIVALPWERPPAGLLGLCAVVVYPPDLHPADNTLWFRLAVGYPITSLIVNEIMFAPFAGEAEYVELFNPGPVGVDLNRWAISDLQAAGGRSHKTLLSPGSRKLGPGDFFVLASDSSILTRFPSLLRDRGGCVAIAERGNLSLKNDGDAVVLSDLSGRTIDSVAYLPAWHNPGVVDATGRSLERIQPLFPSNDRRNWSTCVEKSGGTPGLENSIFTRSVPSNSGLSCFPNPFSPDGDGRDDYTVVHYELSLRSGVMNLKIFDAGGRQIRRLSNNELCGPHGDVLWDGRNDEGRTARIGIYIVVLEAINEQEGAVFSAKTVIVLAGRL